MYLVLVMKGGLNCSSICEGMAMQAAGQEGGQVLDNASRVTQGYVNKPLHTTTERAFIESHYIPILHSPLILFIAYMCQFNKESTLNKSYMAQ